MPTQAFNSVIGNAVAQRKKLAVIRQSTGLEPNANLKQVAPSPANGPANKPGAAQQAMQPQQGLDPATYQHPPEQTAAMLAMIQQHLAKQAPQQQQGAPVDPNQADPSNVANAGATPQNPQAGQVPPSAQAALAPIADFYKQNGRLPTAQELKDQAATNLLQQQLGRPPTPTELAVYQQQPQKGLGNATPR